MDYEVTALTPLPSLPQPPPKWRPEITFTSASKILKELRANIFTCYLGCHSLSLGLKPFQNVNHACEGIPKMHTHLLFQCSECIAAKLHKHKKGFHDENYDTDHG